MRVYGDYIMIAIVDYGAGNIFSLKNALDYLGEKSVLTNKADDIVNADSVILPGVGAFPDARKKLADTGLDKVIVSEAQQKPLLGICLGMQLLFSESREFKKTEGLSLIDGMVDLIKTEYKIPHMGWNGLKIQKESRLLQGVSDGDFVYFVHSFMAYTDDENVSAYCEYGSKITALAEKGYVYGAQFHPEKSGGVGLKILSNFCKLK